MSLMLYSVGFDYFDESCVWVIVNLPVRKGILNLREKSGLLRKLRRSLGMPAVSPALSKYSPTISRKEDSPVTLKG